MLFLIQFCVKDYLGSIELAYHETERVFYSIFYSNVIPDSFNAVQNTNTKKYITVKYYKSRCRLYS